MGSLKAKTILMLLYPQQQLTESQASTQKVSETLPLIPVNGRGPEAAGAEGLEHRSGGG